MIDNQTFRIVHPQKLPPKAIAPAKTIIIVNYMWCRCRCLRIFILELSQLMQHKILHWTQKRWTGCFIHRPHLACLSSSHVHLLLVLKWQKLFDIAVGQWKWILSQETKVRQVPCCTPIGFLPPNSTWNHSIFWIQSVKLLWTLSGL